MEKTINISGRIDSNNSTDIEKKLLAEIADFDGDITLNAEKLEYISSAGLRVILKIKKMKNSLKIINCSPEIYEIFDMTGFTDIMSISKAFRNFSVEGCEVIGKGSNGTVYRIDPETIVKVYNSKNSLETIKRERELSQKAFIKGIPTAIPYDVVKVGDLYGSVFELLNAKSFAQLINEGENLEELIKESVDLMKKFHSIELKDNELPNKKEQQIEKARFCSKYLEESKAKKIINLIENIPDINNIIHGDFQVKNILKQNEEILIIDMDTLASGHPIFEFGAFFATYEGYSCINKYNSSDFLGISYDNCQKIKDLTFEYYFNNKDKDYIDEIKNKAAIIGYIQILYSRLNKPKDYSKDNKDIIDFCIKYLNENIDSIDELFF
ncbi:MAG: phosphotransferase [Clostridia bacterium]|nr:phosphotransferase [Clostridia bacterium]